MKFYGEKNESCGIFDTCCLVNCLYEIRVIIGDKIITIIICSPRYPGTGNGCVNTTLCGNPSVWGEGGTTANLSLLTSVQYGNGTLHAQVRATPHHHATLSHTPPHHYSTPSHTSQQLTHIRSSWISSRQIVTSSQHFILRSAEVRNT